MRKRNTIRKLHVVNGKHVSLEYQREIGAGDWFARNIATMGSDAVRSKKKTEADLGFLN
jgi:hypothetical protein